MVLPVSAGITFAATSFFAAVVPFDRMMPDQK